MAIFAPHITAPKGDELFNLGTVSITWDLNDPPTDDPYEATTVISYEIEYTDNYNQEQTVWHTLKRRIPWVETSFDWVVGKMIKSDSVRIRMRARNSTDGSVSDWSMISGDFSINVFKLIPPAIVSPVANHLYADFILIILDETLTRNTFNQKIRYTLEYSSEKASVDWTLIAKDLPVGQNVIRWDLDGLISEDDYVLRLTAKNASVSCIETDEPTPDQVSRRFIYNLKIQQAGMFIIDTKPPEAILDIETSSGITSELKQTLNIFAEDATTNVEHMQLRECNANDQLSLGPIDEVTGEIDLGNIIDTTPDAGCDNLTDILTTKKASFVAKTQWTLADKSGLRKIEALLTDSGGNNSLQEVSKSFIPVFRSSSTIRDFIIFQEQRDNSCVSENEAGNIEITTNTATFEVAYLVTASGEVWLLEPFPKLVATTDADVRQLFAFGGVIYLFAYVDATDVGTVLRNDLSVLTTIHTFTSSLSLTNDVAEFQSKMYMGLENGELWQFDGVTFILIKTFDNPISALEGDNEFLYVGLTNSSTFSLYNGSDFFDSDLET